MTLVEQRGTCKACGRELVLVRDGTGFTSHHEAPLCPAFMKLLEEAPPDAVSVTVVETKE